LLLVTQVAAQNAVTGVVTDSKSGETMPGVHVYIPELHKGDVTDSAGTFRIIKIPNSEFAVQFSFLGYETILKKIRATDSASLQMSVQMATTAVESHRVVVSAGFISAQDDNAVKIETIRAEELDKSGAIGIMEAIAEKPGVSLISTGPGIAKPVIRGLSGNRVLVVYDGIRMENQQWGAEHGISVDWMGIDRVEIIKGPASLLFGSDAMGGVLNFIDEKPAMEGKTHGSAAFKYFSNTQGYTIQPSVKGAGHRFHWGLNGMFQDHGSYQDGTGTYPANTGFQSTGGNAKVGFHNGWGIFKLNYRYLSQEIGIFEGVPVMDRPGRNLVAPYQQVDDFFLLSQNTAFIGKTRLKWKGAWQYNNRKEFEEGEGLALDMDLETFNYDVRLDFPLTNKIQLISGIQGMWQEALNKGVERIIPDAVTQDVAGYLLAQMDLDQVVVQAGLRYDVRSMNGEVVVHEEDTASGHSHDHDDDELVPFERSWQNISASFGGTFHLSEHFLLRSNTALGFRAPNLSELGASGVHHGANRFEQGNLDLDAERNLEVDMSAHFHSEHIDAEVSVFLNAINNYIYLQPTDSIVDGEYLYNYTANDAAITGLELSFDLHPHPLDWLHWLVTYSTIRAERGDGSFLPLSPADELRNSIQLEGKKWGIVRSPYIKLQLETRFAQVRPAEFETWTPAYNLVHFGIGGKLTTDEHIIIGVEARNIFDEDFIDHLSRFKPDRVRNPGRNISLHLKFLFG
jgi:iron complex outermembrane receptor protein